MTPTPMPRNDGATGEPRVPLREGQQGPLKDLIVLDCSMVWAGPYCTKLLGDMGATIIKIEANRQLDSIRGPAIPPPMTLAVPKARFRSQLTTVNRSVS